MNPLDLSIKDLFATMGEVLSYILSLQGPPLLMVTLIALGYAFKLSPIPNNRIPIIIVILGMALSPLLLPFPSIGDLHYALRFPMVAAVCQVMLQGFLIGLAAWILHWKFIKPLEEKLLNGELKQLFNESQTPESPAPIAAPAPTTNPKP